MTARRIDETAPGSLPAARFGVRLAGVAVAMPAGTAMEFVADAAIYPLPLAPARVAGLMQLRGYPLVVLDASLNPQAGGGTTRHDVLVLGQPPQAAALLVDDPPQALPDGAWRAAGGAPPDCAFASALQAGSAGVSQAGARPGGEVPIAERARGVERWHEIDPAQLFDALMRS
ncbi:MAG: chemotaxis protein CheW [Burkholderiales bacterium]|nr:MAG: chemotaxis protein CheW [Burkholderiales bacterium]